ncbi:hypothetical protein Cni_G03449 [Canna indica]|uniref:DUF4283 domain-containing protein n=1 Tax=Canna indica TaxID=4628 RepID=A0AAQ3JR38_9LILI|nr:hypothetical protein Cni_G03449 [Canna indica]
MMRTQLKSQEQQPLINDRRLSWSAKKEENKGGGRAGSGEERADERDDSLLREEELTRGVLTTAAKERCAEIQFPADGLGATAKETRRGGRRGGTTVQEEVHHDVDLAGFLALQFRNAHLHGHQWRQRRLPDGRLLVTTPATHDGFYKRRLLQTRRIRWNHLLLHIKDGMCDDVYSVVSAPRLRVGLKVRGLPLEFWNMESVAALVSSFARLDATDEASSAGKICPRAESRYLQELYIPSHFLSMQTPTTADTRSRSSSFGIKGWMTRYPTRTLRLMLLPATTRLLTIARTKRILVEVKLTTRLTALTALPPSTCLQTTTRVPRALTLHVSVGVTYPTCSASYCGLSIYCLHHLRSSDRGSLTTVWHVPCLGFVSDTPRHHRSSFGSRANEQQLPDSPSPFGSWAGVSDEGNPAPFHLNASILLALIVAPYRTDLPAAASLGSLLPRFL